MNDKPEPPDLPDHPPEPGLFSPERTVRLLRAKAAELENNFLMTDDRINALGADIALVATLLADHIERGITT